MRYSSILALAAGLLAATAAPALAASSTDGGAAGAAAPSAFSGRWTAGSGASLTIRVNGANATIWGSDGRSSFVVRCRLQESGDKATASCAGDGYDFKSDLPFDYASDIAFEGNVATERWQAFLPAETGEIRQIVGDERFTRQETR